MEFETTPSFDTDYRRVKAEHAAEFKKVVRDKLVPACDAFAADPATPWPAAGVLEVTWSFAGPDGRATFEFVTVDGELRLRWRRVGDHAVFKSP